MTHVEGTGLLDDNQHGFRPGRSCATALSVFSNHVFKELDTPNNNVIVVYFDLKKCFNSIVHSRLIDDLITIFKVNINLVIILYSFLCDREIRIKIGAFVSDPFHEKRGIGQGTVNAAGLFLCFFNKVKDVLFDCYYISYCDDLTIYLSDKDANNGIRRMQKIVNRLDGWCNKVNLCMSYDKTKMMVIRKKQNCKTINEILVCNGHEIERVSVFRLLGVFVDDNFTFKYHSDHVLSKISTNAGMITKMKRMLTPHMFTLLINVYINSVIDYCLFIWGPSRVTDFPKIQNVTNNLIAMFYFPNICKFKKKRFWADRDATELAKARKECNIAHKNINYYNLLEKCNLFTINERLQFYSLLFVFKLRKFSSKVTALNELFSPLKNTCNMITRNAKNCKKLSHTSTLYENSHFYYSSTLWNSITKELHDATIPSVCFRDAITKLLLEKRDDVFVRS
jgi:hypothetical protein